MCRDTAAKDRSLVEPQEQARTAQARGERTRHDGDLIRSRYQLPRGCGASLSLDVSFPVRDVSFPEVLQSARESLVRWPVRDVGFSVIEVSFPVRDVGFPRAMESARERLETTRARDVTFPALDVSGLEDDVSPRERMVSALDRDASFP